MSKAFFGLVVGSTGTVDMMRDLVNENIVEVKVSNVINVKCALMHLTSHVSHPAPLAFSI